MLSLPLADLINWGWLRVGPPYLYLNIDPIIFQIGQVAVRWYGLMYVVGILAGLFTIRGYVARKGISEDVLYRTLWWAIVAGIVGGRLYFVVQQHDLIQDYLLQPMNIIATWKGGMAFYGAIFLVIPTVFWRARREGVNPLVLVDAAVLFAAAGQIFGRIGNIINGDVIGYPSTLPWSTVYLNPNSFASINIPVQPAAAYELLINLVLLGIMLFLARRVTRPGILMLVYLFSYSISQFFLFFVRDNTIETPFGLNWGLKQAQWTSLVLLLILIPITYWVLRVSKRVPAGEVVTSSDMAQQPVSYDTIPSEQPVDIGGDGIESGPDDESDRSNIAESDEHERIGSLHHDESGVANFVESDEHDGIGSLPDDESGLLNIVEGNGRDEIGSLQYDESSPLTIVESNGCDEIGSLQYDESDIEGKKGIQLSSTLGEQIYNTLPANEDQEEETQGDISVDSHAEAAILQDSAPNSQEPIAVESDQEETNSADDPLEGEKEEVLVPVYAGTVAEPEPDEPTIAGDLTAAIPVKQSSVGKASKGRKSKGRK